MITDASSGGADVLETCCLLFTAGWTLVQLVSQCLTRPVSSSKSDVVKYYCLNVCSMLMVVWAARPRSDHCEYSNEDNPRNVTGRTVNRLTCLRWQPAHVQRLSSGSVRSGGSPLIYSAPSRQQLYTMTSLPLEKFDSDIKETLIGACSLLSANLRGFLRLPRRSRPCVL